MSPKIDIIIPTGWRQLNAGEMILSGDYFNTRMENLAGAPYWMPYRQLVGQLFSGLTFRGIRPMTPDAPMDDNFVKDGDIFVYRDFSKDNTRSRQVYTPPEIKTTKSKVSDYLNKFKQNESATTKKKK